MNETLSAVFQKNMGAPIYYQGEAVLPIVLFPLEKGVHEFSLKRIRAKAMPLSGLKLKVAKGKVEIEGEAHSDVVLWSNTSPDICNFKVVANRGCILKIWNVWEVDGLVQAWVGNSGIVVRPVESGGLELRCSDGVGGIDFTEVISVVDFYKVVTD